MCTFCFYFNFIFFTLLEISRKRKTANVSSPLSCSSDARRRAERHPAGDCGGCGHQMLRQCPGNKRSPQPLPAGQDYVGPAPGHVQPVQPGCRLAHHEPKERVPDNTARQTGQLFHQGNHTSCGNIGTSVTACAACWSHVWLWWY